MKQNDLRDLTQIVELIRKGTAQRKDLIAGLILIRAHIDKNKGEMLLDISNCVAHDNRDRGLAFVYISSLVQEFIDCAKNGGSLKVNVLFPLDNVVDQLYSSLVRLGISSIERTDLDDQKEHIKNLLMDVLDGTSIDLGHPNVSKCLFQRNRSSQGEIMCFTTYFHGLEDAPVIQIPSNVAIAFPVFE
jgi:hypothetical protein